MQHPLWYIFEVLTFIAIGIAFIYGPFARTWGRAIVWSFISGCVATASAIAIIIWKPSELTGPAGGFFVIPFVLTVYACILRGMKKLLFRISVLRHIEERLRIRCSKMRSQNEAG